MAATTGAARTTRSGGRTSAAPITIAASTRIPTVCEMLTDRQVDAMLAAAPAAGLWAELGDLLEHLSAQRVTRMAERYAAAKG